VTTPTGKVYLVGAGPGDPKLLTLRAVEVLGFCDVVLVDKLVGRGILEYVRAGAKIVDVGKRAGCHSAEQREVCELLVVHAVAGHNVARLKGGDPFVFGRGGEEIDALESTDIEWEVVPGVTAAVAAAASTGIPLTHRERAASVAFVTGHCETPEKDALGKVGADTVVVYMAGGRMQQIARKLVADGPRKASTPVAIVRGATTPEERVDITTLGTLAFEWEGPAPSTSAPVLAIVGEVAGIRRKLRRRRP
jgi:uroporphyrin-III C-methyltransferase